MLKKVIFGSVIVSFIAGLFFLSGCHKRRLCGMSIENKAEFIFKRVSRKLDLNDSQKARLDDIKDEIVVKIKEQHKDRLKMKDTVLSLLKSDSLDKKQVNDIITKMHAKREAMRPFVVDKIVEIHSILNKEQKDKLANKLERLHKRCHSGE